MQNFQWEHTTTMATTMTGGTPTAIVEPSGMGVGWELGGAVTVEFVVVVTLTQHTIWYWKRRKYNA